MHPAGPRSARTVGTASVVDSAQRRRRDFVLTGQSISPRIMIAHLPNELEQRVTRVSALRFVPVRADRFALPGATFATGHATPLRRMDPEPPITSG